MKHRRIQTGKIHWKPGFSVLLHTELVAITVATDDNADCADVVIHLLKDWLRQNFTVLTVLAIMRWKEKMGCNQGTSTVFHHHLNEAPNCA